MKVNSGLEVHGKVAATFLASSIAIIMIGIFTYMRKQLSWLELYPPAGTFSGIWFYTYIIWIVVWIISFVILRHKESVWKFRTWLITFLASIAVSTILIEASLKWSLVFD